MSTAAKIAKAEKLLAERKQALTLIGRDGKRYGEIIHGYDSGLCFQLDERGLISLETLERWVKQIKTAKKKGYI